MGILEDLGSPSLWNEFLTAKLKKSHLSKKDEIFLTAFIVNEDYRSITNRIQNPDFTFSVPQKKMLNKYGLRKKRIIYTFTPEENAVLKLLAFLLYRYDAEQPPNCYSFRRNTSPKKAIHTLVGTKNIGELYACKIDIRNYFNSIDVDLLLPILKKTLWNDRPLYAFLEKLLTSDRAIYNETEITEKRGAMAGTPISQFFANIYLAEMDRFFLAQNVLYARYSDDIILFAKTAEQLGSYVKLVEGFLERYKLEKNTEKEKWTNPGERWEYLGISYQAGHIGLAESTVQKIKGKIRRKARSIYRWKMNKGAKDDQAIRVLTRVMNQKFFGSEEYDGFTWTKWFFPLITTDHDLREIDTYLQENLRYLATGRHNKSNYRVRYEDLKVCGYKSLVNAYHRVRKTAGKD